MAARHRRHGGIIPASPKKSATWRDRPAPGSVPFQTPGRSRDEGETPGCMVAQAGDCSALRVMGAPSASARSSGELDQAAQATCPGNPARFVSATRPYRGNPGRLGGHPTKQARRRSGTGCGPNDVRHHATISSTAYAPTAGEHGSNRAGRSAQHAGARHAQPINWRCATGPLLRPTTGAKQRKCCC